MHPPHHVRVVRRTGRNRKRLPDSFRKSVGLSHVLLAEQQRNGRLIAPKKFLSSHKMLPARIKARAALISYQPSVSFVRPEPFPRHYDLVKHRESNEFCG